MNTRTITGVGACAVVLMAFFGSGLMLYAQRPTAAQLVPAGFKITADKNFGQGYTFEGSKPNDSCPKAHMNPEVLVGGGWQPNPMASRSIEMMAASPEDPASRMGVTRDEPMGKERYRGGVLTWRKATIPWVGSGNAPDLVTVSGAWAGAGSGMLLRGYVNRVCGTKETVRAWLDPLIDQLLKVK